MLETATAVGVLGLFLACIVLVGYIVFFPLVGTIAGGVQILRIYALKRPIETPIRKRR